MKNPLILLGATLLAACSQAFAGTPATPIVALPAVYIEGYAYSTGYVASSTDIQTEANGIISALNTDILNNFEPLFAAAQAQNNTVRKDLTQGLAQDIGVALQNNEQANVRADTYASEQTPPGMPCGTNACTGQQMMSQIIAGSGGVLGAANAISGATAQSTAANEALTTPQGAFGSLVTYQAHCGNFASQQEITAGVCSSATASVKPNADIDGTTLLAVPSVANDAANPVLDAQARAALVHNLTNTMPAAALQKPNYTTAAGQTEAGLQMSMQARLNLARTVLSQVEAMQAPITGFGPQMQATLNKNLGTAPTIAANASLNQALAWEDKATYGNPTWYIQLQTLHRAAVQKQMVLMQAEELQYQYLAFKERTNIEALLATLVAQQTQQVMRPEVTSQANNTAR